MSIEFYLAIWFLISVISFWISIILKFSRKRKLSREDRKYFKKHFNQINIKLSSKERIIDYDKLYHKVLLWLWYEWTFWEILKQYPIEINDIEIVWELHKLRNKLVHDFDLLDERLLKQKANKYKKILSQIIK